MGKTYNLDVNDVKTFGGENEKPNKNGNLTDLTPDLPAAKEEKKEEPEFPSVSYFSLFRYASREDKLCILIGTLCCIGQGVVQPLNMLVFGSLTQDIMVYFTALQNNATDMNAAKEAFKDDILTYIFHNCLLGVGMLIFSYGASLTFNYSGIRQTYRIRKMFLESALNQDISWYDVHKTGDFASRMSDDLAKLEDGIGEKVSLVVFFQVAFVASLIQALIKGWELTLICLISLPVTMVALGTVAWITSKLAKNELEAYGAAGNIAEEVFSTIRTVVAFGGQEKEMTRYNEHVKFAQTNNIKRSFMNGLGFGLLWFCIYGSYALSFWYGVGLILDEKAQNIPPNEQTYSPGNMVTVFFSVMTASMYFGMSSPYIEAFSIATGAGSKIFGVISSEPTINLSKNKGVELKKLEGNITMKNVKFRYPARSEVEVLKGLNLEIKAGDTVALVGSSGCGKSTCIQLVQRFYDPEEGEVLIDDVNIKDLKLTWLRNKIGVVGQEPVLFDATIADNIRYGYMEASVEEITKAAMKANAHRFIVKLPNGYDTIVGERGAQLSGGQKQRIAIARALVRNPTILLLDEATSALDTNSEAIVQKALDNASSECTTVIIAHRLSTIRGANRIIVIHDGIVVEEGTHDVLMAKEGDYYRLVTAQASADQQSHSVDDNADEVVIEDWEDVNVKHRKRTTTLKKDDKPDLKGVLGRVMKLNSKEWKEITIACLASVATGCAMPVFAILFGEILGILSDTDADYVRSEANLYCIYFAVTGIVVGTATFLQIFLFGIAGEKLTMRVRTDSFATMLRQEIGWYDMKENGVGALCAKLSGEAARVQGATGQRVGTIVQSVSTLVLAISISMYYEWRLGLVTLSFTPIILVALYYQEKFMRQESVGYRGSLERSTKLAVEAVSNIRTVVSLGREETFYNMYITDLVPYTKLAKRSAHVRGAVLGISQSIMFFAMSVCMYYGSYLITEEGMHYEVVFKVSQALIMGTMSIAQGFAFAPNFEKGLIAAAKVFELMDRLPRIRDSPKAVKGSWKSNDIIYDRITFAYPTRNDIQVLRGLDLSVLTGKTVALVGPSGCGKSTIIQLLERYYDPITGGTSIEGIDLKMIKQSDLRYNLGIVSQEPNLFDRTIAENIAYGSNERTVPMPEIIQAAKNANIHDYISKLPQGYETKLGPKGTQLSGGQKQRVAIARALVRNPKILLLDEATSALDTESEKVVQEALDNAKTGRTCITIAHRLSTIQDADVICVINEGVLHEMGTHPELLKLKGLYYKLHSLQSRRH